MSVSGEVIPGVSLDGQALREEGSVLDRLSLMGLGDRRVNTYLAASWTEVTQ